MSETITVHLELSVDTPNSVRFADTYAGLTEIWYRFSCDAQGNIELWATPDGFEHLARYFLKLARTNKAPGYHGHHALEFRHGPAADGPELTIGVASAPEPVA
jgi:hypothetical protein